jgi:hypothetical protein
MIQNDPEHTIHNLRIVAIRWTIQLAIHSQRAGQSKVLEGVASRGLPKIDE